MLHSQPSKQAIAIYCGLRCYISSLLYKLPHLCLCMFCSTKFLQLSNLLSSESLRQSSLFPFNRLFFRGLFSFDLHVFLVLWNILFCFLRFLYNFGVLLWSENIRFCKVHNEVFGSWIVLSVTVGSVKKNIIESALGMLGSRRPSPLPLHHLESWNQHKSGGHQN